MDILTKEEVEELFYASCIDIGVENTLMPERALIKLTELYEPNAFHNWDHICYVVSGAVNYFSDIADNLSELIVSGVYHDAVQGKKSPKNEEETVILTSLSLASGDVNEQNLENINANIMATVPFHPPLKTKDQKIMSDCDLMSLGRPQGEFLEGTKLLWIESGQKDFDGFCHGMVCFFQKMKEEATKREAFFYFPDVIPDYERRVHENIEMMVNLEKFNKFVKPVLKS